MRLFRVCLIVAGAMTAGAGAHAQGALDSMRKAQQLADVLGSEAACGLTYDQEAISAYIDKAIPADDMSFTSNLNMFVSATEFQLQGMSTSAKTAHCTQVRRVAKSFGFLKG
ncbi:signal recognition particle [Pannonibacter phragmitetus]|uniref:signal recognition particle n=1 Tax=Pannonibacter phragmitetus TaxID=121719 RepID=UPI001FFD766A|nr:signal recognition particle [Pannonibacter phragmitetus]